MDSRNESALINSLKQGELMIETSPVKVKLIKAESPAKSGLMNNEKPKVDCPIV